MTATDKDCAAADYATAGTSGRSRATVWDDADSLCVPSGVEIDHAVVVGGGSCFLETTATFTEPAVEYNLSSRSDKVNTRSVAAASAPETGLDLDTSKFSGSGAVARAYGTAWVAEWNRHLTADGIGRP
ncbi:hypothetical protein [Streptomyces sp. NPDC060275]|uniref:hypothetical protein n=1 Tax=Streptomyces sp. NPDC060275 TaxID=3347090 RepID=UPI00365FA426